MKQITKVFSVGLAALMLAGSLNCGVEAFAAAPKYEITYQRGQYRRVYTGKAMSYPKMSVVITRNGKKTTVKNAKLISVSGNKSGKSIDGYTTKYTYKLPNGKKITASKNWWIIPKTPVKSDFKIKTIGTVREVQEGRCTMNFIKMDYDYTSKIDGRPMYYSVSSYDKSGKLLNKSYSLNRMRAYWKDDIPCCFNEPTTFKIVSVVCIGRQKQNGECYTIGIKSDPCVIKTTINLETPTAVIKKRAINTRTLYTNNFTYRDDNSCYIQLQVSKKKNFSNPYTSTCTRKQWSKIFKKYKYYPNLLAVTDLSRNKSVYARVRTIAYSKYQKKNIYSKWSNTVK